MPSDSSELSDLGPTLDFLVHLIRLGHALERASVRMQSELGVTSRQRIVLLCVSKRPKMTAAELAALLHMDAATLSLTLKRLESRGLVARKQDQADRRRLIITLTRAGRAVVRRSSNTVEGAVSRYLEAQSSGARDTMRTSIGALVLALEGASGRKLAAAFRRLS